MNEPAKTPPQETIDILKLGRAIRFALVAIVLALSYVSLRSSLSIGSFSRLFAEMLGGRPLPALTLLVLNAGPVFVAVSVFVPVAALATLFLRSLIESFYIIGALGFVSIAQCIIIYQALAGPLSVIVRGLNLAH